MESEKPPESKGNGPIIGIDGCFLTDFPNTSLAIYLRGLLKQWSRMEKPPGILLFLPRQLREDEDVPKAGTIRQVSPETPCLPSKRFITLVKWQQWVLPRLLSKHRPDIYFSPFHFTPQFPRGMRMVTSIHDLCFLTEPTWSIGSLIHRLQVISACFRADSLICVSNYTAAVLRTWRPEHGKKAVVVQNGHESPLLEMEAAAASANLLDPRICQNRFFVWIGNPSPRKNIEGLMDSFALHSERSGDGRCLVMVSPQHAHEMLLAMAAARGVADRLILLSGIDNVMRDSLYRLATALVFPSFCEGFGYPVLEAMNQGCPTVGCRKGPSQEIIGNLFSLTETLAPEELAGRMSDASNLDPSQREDLGKKLVERAGSFTMEAMAEKTLEAILHTGHRR